MTWSEDSLRPSLASLVAALILLSGPASAGAAITVGQTAPVGEALFVGGPTLCVQDAVGGPPGYTIPAGGGVVTSWSVRGRDVVAPDQAQLKLVDRASSTSFTVVGQDTNRPVASSILNEFSTRIPVSGGELLAMWVPGVAGPCMFSSEIADDRMLHQSASSPEPGIGDTFPTNVSDDMRRVNIAVSLEPDADGDGFGDETQDQCPGQAGPNNGCPAPAPLPLAPAPVGARAADCNGKPASIVGTDGSDNLPGTPAADVIAALGGNDKVSGLAGNDVICGGTGKDKLKGGPGKDTLVGEKGKDALNGGGSKDTCIGGKSNDSASKCEVEKSV